MGFCIFGTIVSFFHLQEKIFTGKDELLNLDLLWKNTPYAKTHESLAAWGQELTFLDHPLPPTSVEAERIFSAAGLFITKLCMRLNDEIVDALCFLKQYLLDLKK